jgi:hypothetical protein
MKGLTTTETRLVEEYVWVLDFLSRCALGVERADWFYLADKADQLADRAGRLAEVAQEVYRAASQGHRPRHQLVRAAIAYHGRHYRAGRLLHPLDPPAQHGEDR